MLQVESLEILKTGANVFLTGVPGAGKTYVINQYIKYLEDKGVYPAVTASTGIAATHVGGQTIHSFAGIGIEKEIDEFKMEKIMEREKLVKKIQNTSVLIIDEISMLDAQTLDNVNKVLKNIKDPSKPFGGLQIIFVGDFFQLPPISKFGEAAKFFAFMSYAWKEAKPLTCYLQEQFRQSDEIFTKLLLAIRENNIEEYHIEILEDLKKKTYEKFGWQLPKIKNEEDFYEEEIEYGDVPTHEPSPLTPLKKRGGQVPKYNSKLKEILSEFEGLGERVNDEEKDVDILELHSHNKNVDEINGSKLNKIKEKEFIFKMLAMGRANLIEALMKNCLSPEILKLKVGAKVIFTKNDMEGKFVNGTLGVVKDLDKESILVETNNGKMVDVKRAEWKIEDDGKLKAKLEQFPLRLAWAITVHKSQGMSLDEAVINLGETFEYGQGYVALSRVRTLEGLYLRSYNPKSLQINPYICEFDEKIRKDSNFIQEKILKADQKKLLQTQKTFIENCGGVWEGGVKKEVSSFAQKKDTQIITLEMLQENKTIEEIVKDRDLGIATILKHLEDLYKFEKLNKLEINKILQKSKTFNKIDLFNIPSEIKKSFKKFKTFKDEDGNVKLAPVFKDLKEKYSYEILRIYRIFL